MVKKIIIAAVCLLSTALSACCVNVQASAGNSSEASDSQQVSAVPDASASAESSSAPEESSVSETGSIPETDSVPEESSAPLLSAGPKYTGPVKTERISIESKCLGKAMKANVYLPADYDTGKKYAVLYLLHGTSYDQNQWESQFDLPEEASKIFNSGRAEPYIIVTPAIGTSYGLNSEPPAVPVRPVINGDYGRYEDYIMSELIPYIDSHYNTFPDEENRFIGGVSMGGFAALRLSLIYPGFFGKVGAHSPSLWQYREDESFFSTSSRNWVYPNEESKKTRDPLLLVKDADIADDVKIWLDCGDRDFYDFYVGTEMMYEALKEKGAQVECHINPGNHKIPYWRGHIEEYLIFYGS